MINTILQELTEPRILGEGKIQEPNNVMRKAAQVIKQLAELADTDKKGRLEAERKLDLMEALNAQLDTELRLRTADSQQAFAAYQEIMNVEYARDFT